MPRRKAAAGGRAKARPSAKRGEARPNSARGKRNNRKDKKGKDRGRRGKQEEIVVEEASFPGGYTPSQWAALTETEIGESVAYEVARAVVDKAVFGVFELAVDAVRPILAAERVQADLTTALSMVFLPCDIGEPGLELNPQWAEDEEPERPPLDAWARGALNVAERERKPAPVNPIAQRRLRGGRGRNSSGTSLLESSVTGRGARRLDSSIVSASGGDSGRRDEGESGSTGGSEGTELAGSDGESVHSQDTQPDDARRGRVRESDLRRVQPPARETGARRRGRGQSSRGGTNTGRSGRGGGGRSGGNRRAQQPNPPDDGAHSGGRRRPRRLSASSSGTLGSDGARNIGADTPAPLAAKEMAEELRAARLEKLAEIKAAEEAQRAEQRRMVSQLEGRDFAFDHRGRVLVVKHVDGDKLPSHSQPVGFAVVTPGEEENKGRSRFSGGGSSRGRGGGGGSGRGGGSRRGGRRLASAGGGGVSGGAAGESGRGRGGATRRGGGSGGPRGGGGGGGGGAFRSHDTRQPTTTEVIKMESGVTLRTGEVVKQGPKRAIDPARMTRAEYEKKRASNVPLFGNGSVGALVSDVAPLARAGSLSSVLGSSPNSPRRRSESSSLKSDGGVNVAVASEVVLMESPMSPRFSNKNGANNSINNKDVLPPLSLGNAAF